MVCHPLCRVRSRRVFFYSRPGRWSHAFGQEDRSEGSGALQRFGSPTNIASDDVCLADLFISVYIDIDMYTLYLSYVYI